MSIISSISHLLESLVSRNDQLPLAPSQVTPFHSSRPPAISVKSYLEDRILKYAGCSEETFILALIYMDQVVQFNPDFVISSLNVHRLLITSIMLASKFFDDVYYNNAYYARVGGISNAEVNSLEMEMLRMISFSLFVQPEQYERYKRCLCAKGGSGSKEPHEHGACGDAPLAVVHGDGACSRGDGDDAFSGSRNFDHLQVCSRDAMDVQ